MNQDHMGYMSAKYTWFKHEWKGGYVLQAS